MKNTFFDEQKPCENCYILINDLGVFQCRDCGAFFDDAAAIRRQLCERFGADFVGEEYEKLMAKRRLVRKGKGGEITNFQTGENGEAFERAFYEL